MKYFVKQVLEALVYLHEVKGVLHRDIKPENVFIDSGTAKLGDFGCSVSIEELKAIHERER